MSSGTVRELRDRGFQKADAFEGPPTRPPLRTPTRPLVPCASPALRVGLSALPGTLTPRPQPGPPPPPSQHPALPRPPPLLCLRGPPFPAAPPPPRALGARTPGAVTCTARAAAVGEAGTGPDAAPTRAPSSPAPPRGLCSSGADGPRDLTD
ncbi:hypothetical protein CapIbe_003419 [Capra ibex]